MTKSTMDILSQQNQTIQKLILCITAVALLILYAPNRSTGSPEYNVANASLLRNGGGNMNDYSLAMKESLHFFDDIPAKNWNLLKQKVKRLRETPEFPYSDYRHKHSGFYFQYHHEPDFTCQHEERIGSQGDGGKWVCDTHRIRAQESCLVYSVGSRGDFSFEKSVLEEVHPNCEIHTFDFKDYSQLAKEAGSNYHPWGLGKENGRKPFGELKTLKDTIKLLGHEGRVIDIFKIDCDGCEFGTVRSWFEADVMLRQILVEVHSTPEVTPQHMEELNDFFAVVPKNNYVMFHKEANIAHPLNSPVEAVEYCYLKLAPEFFV